VQAKCATDQRVFSFCSTYILSVTARLSFVFQTDVKTLNESVVTRNLSDI